MPKMNVAFSLDAEELKQFDDWRASLTPPLARGPALVRLFKFMGPDGSMIGMPRLRRTMVVEEEPTSVDPAPTFEKKEALPLIRSPEDKAAALALLKPKLAELPDVKGIHEQNREKPDPPGWDEFDQSGKDSE